MLIVSPWNLPALNDWTLFVARRQHGRVFLVKPTVKELFWLSLEVGSSTTSTYVSIFFQRSSSLFMLSLKMGVVLRNLQKAVPLRRARLRKDVDTLRHILGIQKFDLGIICVDNHKIQQINNIYRKKNVPTDVLSFPFYEVKYYLLHTRQLSASVCA